MKETSPITKTIFDNGYDKLRICKDADTDINDPDDWHIILHHEIPSLEDYRHIKLEKENAVKLYKWLQKFLQKTQSVLP